MNRGDYAAAWTSFDAIYLINLPERTDRKRELERELNGVGLSCGDPKLVWIRAVRPSDAGEFPSLGAKGCFMSHLTCLTDALDSGHRCILIIEDDACFPKHRHAALRNALEKAHGASWEIWYGGGQMPDVRDETGTEVVAIDSTLGVQTSHCIALRGDAIRSVAAFFELILTRPGGHPEAGPMHVDGAYSTWRAMNPAAVTLVSLPPVCIQRSSRSDIAATRWFDETPVLRTGVALLRRLLNRRNA